MYSRLRMVVLSLAALLSGATASFAEPIVIGGRIQYQRGEEGFLEFGAPGLSASGFFGLAARPPGSCSSCDSGAVFNPGGAEDFFDLTGQLVINNKTFSLVRGEGVFIAPSLRVPQLDPGPEAGEAFGGTSGPFRFAGFLEGENAIGEQIRVHRLGTGKVDVGFDQFGNEPIAGPTPSTTWLRRVRYPSRRRSLCSQLARAYSR
jgi:hypothetical protein